MRRPGTPGFAWNCRRPLGEAFGRTTGGHGTLGVNTIGRPGRSWNGVAAATPVTAGNGIVCPTALSVRSAAASPLSRREIYEEIGLDWVRLAAWTPLSRIAHCSSMTK